MPTNSEVEHLARLGRPGVAFLGPDDAFDHDAIVTPWGWEPRVVHWAERRGLADTSLSLDAVRDVNNRWFSFDLEDRFSVGLPGQAACRTLAGVAHATESLARWLIKASFGAAGRERLSGSGPLAEDDARWVERRLARDQFVFVEPFVEAFAEAGIQWDIPPTGREPTLVGVTPLLSDDRGQYAGSIVQQTQRLEDGWPECVATTRMAARNAQAAGYVGPLGIDAMRWRDAAGARRVRPLQDINARWTMGRLALGWRDQLGAEDGVLRLGSPADFAASSRKHETVPISPATLAGTPVQHFFWLEKLP